MRFWTSKRDDLPSIWHAIRTAIAAVLSVSIARFVGMPEAYWAAIATLVVMQSTLRIASEEYGTVDFRRLSGSPAA